GVVDFAQNDCTFFGGVLGGLAQRLLEGAFHGIDADLVIAIGFEFVESVHPTAECNSAARDDSLFNRRARRMHRIFHAGFLLFHFGFGGSADFNDGHTADQLRQPLLQLLAVVVTGGLIDLAANFFYAAFDLVVLAFAFDDGGVV